LEQLEKLKALGERDTFLGKVAQVGVG
jgi:hypothetical protein